MKESANVKVGETIKLKTEIVPKDATDKTIVWSSDDPTIAVVTQSGVVKGIKTGYTVIRAFATDGSGTEAVCSVDVTKPAKVKISANEISLKASDVMKKDQTIKADKAFAITKTTGDVTYIKTKGNKKIVVSKNGKITVRKGLKKGTYKITVKVNASGDMNYRKTSKTVTVAIVLK